MVALPWDAQIPLSLAAAVTGRAPVKLLLQKAGSPCSSRLPRRLGNCWNPSATSPLSVKDPLSVSPSGVPPVVPTVSYSQPLAPFHQYVGSSHTPRADDKVNAWYLDDGTLCGSPDDLATALRIVEQEGPAARGLNLNRAKSLVYIAEDADPSNIPVTRVGFTLLGCPIGPPLSVKTLFHGV